MAAASVELTSPYTTIRAGAQVDEDPIELDHDGRRLGRMGARADVEVDVRLGQVQLTEEDPGHRLIVVLARVDEDLLDSPATERTDDRGGLHEVGSRPDHVCYRPGHDFLGSVGHRPDRPMRSGEYGRRTRAERRALRLRNRAGGAVLLVRDVAVLAFGKRADGRPRSIARAVGDLRTYAVALRFHASGDRARRRRTIGATAPRASGPATGPARA